MALLPTLSHALAAARGEAGWAEICTPQGTRVVADAGGGVAPASGIGGPLDHCPYCVLAAQAALLPPSTPVVVLRPRHAESVPRLLLRASRTPFEWAAAQPRGPPALA